MLKLKQSAVQLVYIYTATKQQTMQAAVIQAPYSCPT